MMKFQVILLAFAVVIVTNIHCQGKEKKRIKFISVLYAICILFCFSAIRYAMLLYALCYTNQQYISCFAFL